MGLEGFTIIIAFWALIATAAAAVAGFRAAREQRENNTLERRNGDLQAMLLQIEEHRDRRAGPERRAAVGSALLADLYVVEDYHFNAYSDAHPSAFESPLRTPTLDRLTDFVDLFPVATVHALSAVVAHLARVPHQVEEIRRAHAESSDRHPPMQVWMIRIIAAYVLKLTERARERLIEDGGTPVEERPSGGLVFPNAPPLPVRLEAKLDWPISDYAAIDPTAQRARARRRALRPPDPAQATERDLIAPTDKDPV